MKTYKSIGLLSLAVLLFTGCVAASNNHPPSAFERKVFDITTNQVESIVHVTNTVTVPLYVTITNQLNEVIIQTNLVTVPQIVHLTNHFEAYDLEPKQTTTQAIGIAGTIGNAASPGAGTLVAGVLTLLLGAWGHFRSYKKTQTNEALAQEVETIREFIKSLPQGAKYDQAIVSFMQQHQMEAGVADQVLGLLENRVDNPEAQAAVKQLHQALGSLVIKSTPYTTPPTPISPSV